MRRAVGHHLDDLLAYTPTLVWAHVAQPTKRKSRYDGVAGASDLPTVERALAYLASLRDIDGERADDAALDVIAHLLERAEAATRRVAVLEREVRRAQQQAQRAVAHKRVAMRRHDTLAK